MNNRALLWLDRELRVSDNPILNYAIESKYSIAAVAFMPKHRKSLHSQAFYIQTGLKLQSKLSQYGIQFLLSDDDPATAISQLCSLNQISIVVHGMAFNHRDKILQERVKAACPQIKFVEFNTQTLFEIDTLPFSIEKLPKVFTPFRKLVEGKIKVAKEVQSNLSNSLGFQIEVPSPFRSRIEKYAEVIFPFSIAAGEDAAKERILDYIKKNGPIATYKDTRNGMLAADDSAKISAALSCGAISVRTIYARLKWYLENFSPCASADWFFLELLWREYFKLLSLSVGEKLFRSTGLSGVSKHWNQDETAFANWTQARTQNLFIDCNMFELKSTGWMSNRGRQNVASYLAKHVEVDWTLGAKYFEEQLIDADIELNWGNWLYLAGVGTDPRDRKFNIERQAEMYDPDHQYRDHWAKKIT